MRSRLTIAALLALCIGLIGMSARVAWLASGHAKGPNDTDLHELYVRQHTATIHLSARRGDIYDCRGRRLAGSVDVPSIFADPAMVDDIEDAATKLHGAIDAPSGEIATVLAARKDKRFAWVQRRVTEEQAEKVKALRLEGIGIQREPFRSYPNGPLAAHVLGFVGADQQGLAGVELQYDEKLRGADGYKICTKDAAGRILSLVPNGYQPARDGCNVVLTSSRPSRGLPLSRSRAPARSWR
jgi:cell division protein FtsI/penicillin-binding protein 2